MNVLINHQAPPLVRRAIRHRAKNSPLAEVFPDISELDAFVSRADLLGAKGSGKSAALRAIERRLLLHPAFNSETAFSRPCWLPIYINLSDGDFQPGPGVKQCPAGNLLAFLRQVVPTHISVEAGQQVELSALRYLLTNSQSLADFDSLLSSPILFLIDVNSSALLEVARSFAAQCDRELPAAGYLVARQPDWAPSISEAVISISKPTLAVIRESLNCSEEFVCKALKGSTDAHRVLTNLSLLKLLQDTHQPREEKIDSYELMNSSFLSLIDVPELDEREQFVQWLFEPEKKSKSLDALLRNKFSMIAESLGLLKSRVGASGWIDDFLTANRLARMGKIGGPAGLKKLILSSEPSLEAMTLLMRLVDEETAISVLEELAQRDLSAMFRILTSLPRELAVRLNTRGKFSHAVLASVKPSLSDDATQYEARLRTLQSLSWLDPRAGLPLPMVQFSLRDGVNAQIGQFPVTRYQFEEFVRQDGYKEGALWPNKSFYDRAKQIGLEAQRLWELATTGLGNAPMTDVFFPEAVAFCNWLSKRFSGKFMLPTADQWLDAAGFPRLVQELISSSKSAIDIRQIRVLEGGNPGVRWSPKEMTPIGLTPPNQNGANDMLGCVWEWCDTWVMPENVNGAPSMTDGRLTAPIALRGSPHSGASTMYDVLGAQLAMAQSSSRAGFRVLHFPFENSSHHSGIAK
ncbi:SUMF1/EgtB/PvdO family nonheme iron enzyme [Bradyrhizobium canariense]|uniref:SUMF1/EgtB/PvdO family nonheme iron enzyme n=1 Tax=Bradyrhizobium canariense TaxID=255045 RepID=UPI001FEDB6D5|nr:SUMF1/EgtB/PvdO family nonheme iron enzyme [Bradyrhizobium canariense]MBM7488125.1 hypothetical protein [Bradyrhizobium canariense]